MSRSATILGLALVPCAFGCRVPDVTMSRSAPSAFGYSKTDCRLLGPVEGDARQLQPEPWKRTERFVEEAMQDMRDRAGRMGANFVQIDHTEGSEVLSEEGWLIPIVKATGAAYRCSGTPAMRAHGDASTPDDGGPKNISPRTDGATPSRDASPPPDGSPPRNGSWEPDRSPSSGDSI
jgi:hypothetical protein